MSRVNYRLTSPFYYVMLGLFNIVELGKVGEYAQNMAQIIPHEGRFFPRLFTGRYLVHQGCETLNLTEVLLGNYPEGEKGIEALAKELLTYMAPELTAYGLFWYDFGTARLGRWFMETVTGSPRSPFDSITRPLIRDFNLEVRGGTRRVVRFDANGLVNPS